MNDGLLELESMAELLHWRAAKQGSKIAFTFLNDGEFDSSSLSYEQLALRAAAIAGHLEQLVPKGGRVLLCLPQGLEFITSFYACLCADVVAVPVYPPNRSRFASKLDRLARIAANAGVELVLSTKGYLAEFGSSFASHPVFAQTRTLAVDELADASAIGRRSPRRDDVAFLQYTSGSTSEPKGVTVRHGNLLANVRAIQGAFDLDAESRIFSWLPFYHDMGLIGKLLTPVYVGGTSVLMTPAHFVERPARWLAAMSRYGSQICAAPNSAYELCVRTIEDHEIESLDLRAWRSALNGAEPVSYDTMRRFAQRFAHIGFRADAFKPAYGLAEATLFVSGGRYGDSPLTVSKSDLVLGRAVPKSEGAAQDLVACGASDSVEIVQVDGTAILDEGVVGEICITGPSIAAGYWNNREATAASFGLSLAGRAGNYFRTGDLGFKRNGQLFVTGRAKDLIILGGKNHYPQDIEATVLSSHAAFSEAGGAAFSIEVDGKEVAVVVHAIDRRKHPDLAQMLQSAREAVTSEHEVSLHDIVLVDPSQLPKTSSGKIRRHACRAAYLANALKVTARSRSIPPDDALSELQWRWVDKPADAPTLPFGRGIWLIIGPDQPLSQELVAMLSKRGDQCLAIQLHADDAEDPASSRASSVERTSTLDTLTRFVRASRGTWRGVIVVPGALEAEASALSSQRLRELQQLLALVRAETRLWWLRRSPGPNALVQGTGPAPLPAELVDFGEQATCIELPSEPIAKEAARVHQELWSSTPEERILLLGSKRYVLRLTLVEQVTADVSAEPGPIKECVIWVGPSGALETPRRCCERVRATSPALPKSIFLDRHPENPERFVEGLRHEGMKTVAVLVVNGGNPLDPGLPLALAEELADQTECPLVTWTEGLSEAQDEVSHDWRVPLCGTKPRSSERVYVRIDGGVFSSENLTRQVLERLSKNPRATPGCSWVWASQRVVDAVDKRARGLELLRKSGPPPALNSAATPSSAPPVAQGSERPSAPAQPKLEHALDPTRQDLMGLDADARLQSLRAYVAVLTSRALGTRPAEVDLGTRLTDIGLDSMQMTELRTVLEKRLRVRIPMAALINGPTGEQLASLVEGLMLVKREPSP